MGLLDFLPREERLGGIMYEYPSIVLSISLLYLFVVLIAGPRFMAQRKAFNLRAVTRVFNACQIICNLWFANETVSLAWRHRNNPVFSVLCSPPSTSTQLLDPPEDMDRVIFISQVYLYVRMTDYFDTLFFVLSKKQSHVSFLHVYHHFIVVVVGYIYVRSGWGPTIFYASLLNSIVHIIMYSYYFLSTFPSLRRFLWWKRYLTVLQIVQFVVIFFQQVFFALGNCGYPPFLIKFNLVQGIVFISLFSRFYFENYSKKQNQSKIHKS